MRTCLTAFALVLVVGMTACSTEPTATPMATATEMTSAQGARIEAHVKFLAHDLLEGREAGTRGYDIAAHYVASQMAAIGLTPAGDDGSWMQRVPLLRGKRVAQGSALVAHRDTGSEKFEFETDYLPRINYHQPSSRVRAPAVFVGQAVVAPEFDHDDLAGVDLTGKIALLFSGAPASFPNDPRAYYSSSRTKMTLLAERGAIGAVFLRDPKREDKSPWARGAANWQRPGMRLRDKQDAPIDAYPQLLGRASVSLETVQRLFAGTTQTAGSLFERLEAGTLSGFELGYELEIASNAQLEQLESFNVVGQLAGKDTSKSTEHLVYSAHLDHVGIGAPVDGDRIYNGAMDNALGIGILLETARLMTARGATDRSQIFLAVTAEEKGLLGSDYFAGKPSVSGDLVANINMDMPVIMSEQSDVLPIGIEHTDLAAAVKTSADNLGIGLSADPFPDEVVFIRSDQFSFIRRGVPAIYIDGGIVATDASLDGKQQLTDFLRNHYHQPSDQTDLPIHYPSAARLADLNAAVGALVGNQAERPRWNVDDFFGDKFAPFER